MIRGRRRLSMLVLAFAAAAPAQPGIVTDRPVRVTLPLPAAEDAFTFAVLGDRTSGPPEGIAVLAQAVREINLLGPDLVLTVGDMIQGYNAPAAWQAQMREYRATMADLRMPWFPVAGNHDTYWGNRPDRPRNEHDDDYERSFGPLWYAFAHKGCWFVVLYSDEGDPETGRKSFAAGPGQQMSPAQLAWLKDTLGRARGARHVFLFLHHPRWIEARYGDTWRVVHEALAAAGNVSAVFAGHIHQQQYHGPRDGIEYFTLATTGGSLSRNLPVGGFQHHFLLVTVRDRRLSVATVPVGSVVDPRVLTPELTEALAELHRRPGARVRRPLLLDGDLAGKGTIQLEVVNPTSGPLEVEVAPQDRDGAFTFAPDRQQQRVAAGATAVFHFRAERRPQARDPWFSLPVLRVERDYAAGGSRYRLPPFEIDVPVVPGAPIGGPAADLADGALHLDGRSCLWLEDEVLALPDGPFTVEAWVQADQPKGRRGLLSKMQSSEFGLLATDGRPAFLVHLDGAYAQAAASDPLLERGKWHHVAGVFDGTEARLYVDGRLRGRAPARGARTRNALPLLAGADPRGDGQPDSFFAGRLDDVRVSTGARYAADFAPARPLPADEATLLLWPCDQDLGPWSPDRSGSHRHAIRVGGATCRAAGSR